MPSRAQIAEAARAYLGVRWRHCGRDRQNGLDCVGLLLAVSADVGYAEAASFDPGSYSRRPDGVTLTSILRNSLVPVQEVREGSVVAFWIDAADRPTHVAIVGKHPRIEGEFSLIHSHAKVRQVVEVTFDAYWRSRVAEAFAFPGTRD